MASDVVQVWWTVIIGTSVLVVLGCGLVAAMVLSQRRFLRAERRRLEEQRLAEERFRTLVSASPLPIVVEGRSRIMYANSAASELLGMSSAAVLQSASLLGLLGADTALEHSGLLDSVIDDKHVAHRRELSVTTPDGEHRIVELSACPAMFGGEDAAQIVLVDLTDRKRTEDALARETERLGVTLRSIQDGVIACDRWGVVNLMNEACEALTGWQMATATGRRLDEILTVRREADGAPLHDLLKTVSNGEPLLGLAGYGFLTARDGSVKTIEAEGSPIRGHTGETLGAVIALRDVTTKKRLEQEMLRAEKMETVGLLAAGIAHDFNNILAAALANLSLAASLAEEPGQLEELLTEAKNAILRAREITRQFHVFSTDDRRVKRYVSLADILKETTAFTLRGSHVTHIIRVAEDLWPVEVDVGQMSQVINNLLINAVQAMPDGGTITVIAENATVDEFTGVPLSPGRYVRTRVSDQGYGIPKENMSRLFEPFFTTKPKGSGLGLASVYTIVKSHDGHVAVESEPGDGAAFSVWLPAALDTKEPEPVRSSSILLSGRRILVADDDVDVRTSTCRLLEHLGCDVDVVADGATAVAAYQTALNEGRRFDVVILDLSASGSLSGAAATRELAALDQNVRAIAASGHFDDKTFPKGSEDRFRAVLFKPFTEDELREAIIQALG